MAARPYNDAAEIAKLVEEIDRAKKRALKIIGKTHRRPVFDQINAAYGELVDAQMRVSKAKEAQAL